MRSPQVRVDGVKQRVQAHRLAAFAQEGAAGRGARRVTREMLGAESFEGRLEHRHLETGHGRIVHLGRGAHLAQARAESRVGHDGLRAARALHFQYRGHVDVQDIDRMAAGGAIRRVQRRIGRKQRVHRADADEVRALRRRQPQHFHEVGEIAHAPVVLRAQRVQLHRHAPELAARAECRRLVALVRRDDQRATLGAGEFELDSQAVISRRKIRQRQIAQHEPAPVLLMRAAFRQIPGADLAAALAAALELHAPAQQRIVFDGRRIQARGARATAQHHHVA